VSLTHTPPPNMSPSRGTSPLPPKMERGGQRRRSWSAGVGQAPPQSPSRAAAGTCRPWTRRPSPWRHLPREGVKSRLPSSPRLHPPVRRPLLARIWAPLQRGRAGDTPRTTPAIGAGRPPPWTGSIGSRRQGQPSFITWVGHRPKGRGREGHCVPLNPRRCPPSVQLRVQRWVHCSVSITLFLNRQLYVESCNLSCVVVEHSLIV
jgi:hypothetical protein